MGEEGGTNMHWWYGGWWGGLGMILFWIVVFLGIIWLVRVVSQPNSKQEQMRETSQSALEILQRRYASGEISKEEYLEIKGELRQG